MNDLIKVKCLRYKSSILSSEHCINIKFDCSILKVTNEPCCFGIIEIDWITFLRYNNIFVLKV